MNTEYKRLLKVLFVWQMLILLFFSFGINFLPLQPNYLGGSVHFREMPLLWAHGNYDGEHYLEIAQFGYGPFRYFFFPSYPILIRFFAQFLHAFSFPLPTSGVLITGISFFVGFPVLYRLLRLDYSKSFSLKTVVTLLLFPASFYFTAIYTESLFLALAVSVFYFSRKGNWIATGIFGMFAASTRIIGLGLFISVSYEWFIAYKRKDAPFISFIPLLLIPCGLLFYMYYLQGFAGDPLAFFHNLSTYGGQRSDHFVILPQVFYRYIFKILPHVTQYLPILLSSYFEFLTGLVFLLLSVWSFFKLRVSYSLFLLFGYLVPTLTGSFSSMPRYMIILFPAFILIQMFLEKRKLVFQLAIYVSLLFFLGLFTAMFSVGYWVS